MWWRGVLETARRARTFLKHFLGWGVWQPLSRFRGNDSTAAVDMDCTNRQAQKQSVIKSILPKAT